MIVVVQYSSLIPLIPHPSAHFTFHFSLIPLHPSPHPFLQPLHFGGFFGLVIIPAAEVHEAVDEVEEEFFIESEAVVRAFAGGGIGAHEYLAVMESDNIGGRGIAKKIGVNLANDFIRNNGGLNLCK